MFNVGGRYSDILNCSYDIFINGNLVTTFTVGTQSVPIGINAAAGDHVLIKAINTNKHCWFSNYKFKQCIKSIDEPLPTNTPVASSSIFDNFNSLETVCPHLLDNIASKVGERILYFLFRDTILKEIPEGLFDCCTSATTAQATFSGTQVSSIPPGLFDNCPNITVFHQCFLRCPITSIPPGLFDHQLDMITVSQCFSNNQLTSIPENLFINNAKLQDVEQVFASNSNLVSVPLSLFANNVNLRNVSYAFYQCKSLALTVQIGSEYVSDTVNNDIVQYFAYGCKEKATVYCREGSNLMKAFKHWEENPSPYFNPNATVLTF